MRILGIIPSRFLSSRFPGKPLIDLKSKTMIQRVYEGAKKSKYISELVVATDDYRIFNEVKSFGGKVEMTSMVHSSGTDRCGEVIDKYNNFDLIVNIQGDEPLVDYRQLDSLIEVFYDSSVQIATLATETVNEEDIQNVNKVKIVIDQFNNALYFSRSPIPNYKNFLGDPLEFSFLKHIGLYAYRSDILKELILLKPTLLEKMESLEQLRWLYYGFKIKIVKTDIETPNVDIPSDVDKVLSFL
jgi:3-deoxy-manno-octulosonate cytidylyltransferase (CMP-KDO synthetase)